MSEQQTTKQLTESLTNDQLREILKKHSVVTSGNKKQLLERIQANNIDLTTETIPSKKRKNTNNNDSDQKSKKTKSTTTSDQTTSTSNTSTNKKQNKSSSTTQTSKKRKNNNDETPKPKKTKTNSQTTKKHACDVVNCGESFGSMKDLQIHKTKDHKLPPNGWKFAKSFSKPHIPYVAGKPSSSIKNGTSYELFTQIFNYSMMQHVATRTNEKLIANKLQQITVGELNQYFSIIFTMGLIRMPEMNNYWCKLDDIFGNDLIADIMTKKRFREIHTNLSFDIDQMLKDVCQSIHKSWLSSNIVAVDECLILFKGRFKGRQHVKGKPNATGLKLYIICDDYGMPIWFWLYKGKGNESNEGNTINEYVMNLVRKLPNYQTKKYVVLADQFYGSATLADSLKADNFEFVLSCQANHPATLYSQCLQVGLKKKGDMNFVVKSDDSMAALSIYDSGKCNFIASVGSTEIPQSELDRQNRKNSKKIARCDILSYYNKKMGSVDNFDAALNLYHFRGRHHSWKRSMFFSLMKMSVVSSLRIFQYFNTKPGGKRPQQLGHLVAIIRSLSNRMPRYKELSVHLQHYPKKVGTCQRCEYCKSIRKDSKTNFKCVGCDTHLHPQCWIHHHHHHHQHK